MCSANAVRYSIHMTQTSKTPAQPTSDARSIASILALTTVALGFGSTGLIESIDMAMSHLGRYDGGLFADALTTAVEHGADEWDRSTTTAERIDTLNRAIAALTTR